MSDITEPTNGDLATATTTTDEQKSKRKRGGKRKSREQRYKEKQPRPDYRPIVKDNENLVKYYKQQSILLEGEFDEFMSGLRDTLPASFRINTFDIGQANFLKHLIEGPELSEFLKAPAVSNNLEGKDIEDSENVNSSDVIKEAEAARPVLQPLEWYPKRLGWRMNTTRLDLKRTPILQQFHRFLMAETDNGFISRQEAVSMIPPLLLDVHRGQDIMDMCAAPGSKTAQLLEYLKYDVMGPEAQEVCPPDSPFDDGMVVANDVDNKRCYMLVHQSSRLNSPNCVIINQDAARLPDMKTIDEKGQTANLKFDRILCDVPCSGDGTVRKNPDVWKKWSVGNANNFHGMQCKILRRGIELLKENGLLVYSTCSMNPVEDEAVIASILRASQGKVVLEDFAQKLPGLKFRQGTTKWVVMNREAQVVPSIEQVLPENVSQIYPSLFPPTEEEAKDFNLHRCIRILPHFQDTGGFFVAVLRKLSKDLPWQTSSDEESGKNENSSTSNNNQSNQPNPKKRRRFGGFKEDPFYFMDENDPDWIAIKNCYGISDNFPVGQLVHRCTTGKKRSIYLVSKKTRAFIIANREEADKRDFVKIINAGMRLFSRADTESGFRICQDGVSEILPYIKDDIKVLLNKDDLVALLKSRTVAHDLLSSSEHVKDKINPGSFILVYKHLYEDTKQSIELPLVAWKGQYTIALYVSKTYRVHLCALAQIRIGEDGALKVDTKDDQNEDDTKGEQTKASEQ